MKRSRLLLAIILVAVTVLCTSFWVGEGPLWRVVMTKLESHEPVPGQVSGQAGWVRTRRWCGRLHSWCSWYVENGFMARQGETVFDKKGTLVFHQTEWNRDGSIKQQDIGWYRGITLTFDEKPVSPPWLWGVTNQTEPTAPWIKKR